MMIMTANQDNNDGSIITYMIMMLIIRKYNHHDDVMIFLNKRIKIKNYLSLFLENINI
jgi:hypothetical protein